MKIRAFSYALGGLALAATLAACSGFNTSVPRPPAPTTCVVPAGVQTQLIYPVPGATSVPDNPQQIVFATSAALPSWDAVLTGANQAYYGNAFVQISAGQVPSPSATPSFANPIYESSTLASGLTANTVMSVYLNDLSSSCIPVSTNASFTTL